MKNKFISNLKSLFKSTISNKALFERRKNSFLAPILIFFLTICMMILPTYINFRKINSEAVIRNFPYIEEPMKVLLTSSLDCSVVDGKLSCNENADVIHTVAGKDIKYTVIANQDIISANIDLDVIYNTPKDTDNYIILFSNYIKIRYVHRDHVNKSVSKNEIFGDYSKFEGLNFKELSQKIENNPDIINDEIDNFILNAYLSTQDTNLLVNISTSLFSFTLFILVSTIVLKWPTLFKRKKGFKYRECLKLSLTSSLPALILGVLMYLISGIDFSFTFGIVFMIRILFIYFKYIFSNKTSIFNELYEETHEERFKI